MIVNVGTENRVKRKAVENVFNKVFDQEIEVKKVSVDTGIPEQPFDQQVIKGAMIRAKIALKDADFGVGIEAGLIWNLYVETHFDVQYCAVVDRSDNLTVGQGPGFVYPERVIKEVINGKTVGQVMDEISGEKNLGQKKGAIGYLTGGLLPRTQLTELAVLMALLPRIKSELYE